MVSREIVLSFAKSLVKHNLFEAVLCENEEMLDMVQAIISNPKDYEKVDRPSVQLILSEWDDWIELYGNMQNKTYYFDYDKEFVSKPIDGTSWRTSISRGEYTDLTVPMIPEELSDEKMQTIVDQIGIAMSSDYDASDLELLAKYRSDAQCDMSETEINRADKLSEREFEYFENIAREYGMRYWEDLTEDEYDILTNIFEDYHRKVAK